MQETIPNNQKPLDLETAFNLYQQNLLRTAVKLLKRKGIENAETVAPDIVQETYLALVKRVERKNDLPNNKGELLHLLNRLVQTQVEDYLTNKFATDKPGPYKMRESHLASLDEAEDLVIAPSQEVKKGADLEKLINGVTNITPIQKKILIARYVQDKTLKEIAAELGMNSYQVALEHEVRALEKLKNNPKFKNLER